MYQESSNCFEPKAMMAHGTGADCFLQMVSESEAVMSATQTFGSVENLAYSYSSGEDANAINRGAMEHPQQNSYNYSNSFNTHQYGSCDHEELHSFPHFTTTHQFSYPTPTPTIIVPTKPMGYSTNNNNNNNVSSVSYDPFLHLNLQAPPELRNDIIAFGETQTFQDFENETQDFRKRRGRKRTQQEFTSTTTERQRRVDLSGKFDALKELIPNPSKSDRASVVGDAINYIRELKGTLEDLKLLVERKRHEKHRMMRHKVEAEGDSREGQEYSESLRSSWVQRKSKDTEVDVRIIDNEVTIKVVQRNKVDCLVHVSHVLDQLNLDLQHVSGGHIGNFCSYLFNTKIYEGSSIYASAIANKLIQVLDSSLTAVRPEVQKKNLVSTHQKSSTLTYLSAVE
ncbi:hypothetical protein VNO78_27204 [Psophocarpus tetragonolobus]|uniref:BHLH domain-containing protein n=1 Tax=Psophocarpus tetragonolobus TaxID=3891 RepID=A0AAN9XA89_PSOTE